MADREPEGVFGRRRLHYEMGLFDLGAKETAPAAAEAGGEAGGFKTGGA